jgi:PQQ-dependent dehydrogenase (methanol/ethanol family)
MKRLHGAGKTTSARNAWEDCMRAHIATLAAALALVGLSTQVQAQAPAAVDAARLAAADAEPGNWMSYGRTYDEQRFSPLEQINPETVGDLGLAWWMDLDSNRSQETTPLVIDGVMYITLQWSVVRAVDAKTGALIWEYDPQVPHEWGGRACCGADSRGVAAWNGKIYIGTVDGRLVAIDAATGERVWETLTIDQSLRYSISGAPRVAKGKVLIGNSGADFGARGYVSAYDAETGEMDWRFYTVPGDPADGFENDAMAMAAETWDGEWWWLGGGGTVWDSIVYDPVTDLVYIGVGNGSPWPAQLRSPGGGDHLFLSSIVALDPDDGSYVWHYQTTPNDSWDFTATQPIMVADLEIEGRMRRVVMQAPKNGFFYMLDAATGEFISAENYVPVNWASHVEPETGRPIVNPEAHYDVTGEPTFVMPSAAGGHSWHPMSMSPETGLVYIPAMYSFWVFALYDTFEVSPVSSNSAVDYSVHYRMAASPDLPPEARNEYGGALLAWDPVAQKLAWRVPYPRRGGGTLATAGGLVFQGDSDGVVHAYRATDGEELWSTSVNAGVVAAPISYEVDGEQYVAVAIGSGVGGYYGPRNGRLLAFKIGGEAEAPALPPYVEQPFNAPELTASTEVVAHGEDVYFRNCALCHGVSGEVRGGLFPDLRRSFATSTPETFQAVVLEGALEQNGMRSFAEVLTADDAEAVRAYIASLARQAIEAAGQ